MLLLVLSMAIGLEFIQMALPYRTFNINDLIANVGGVTVGEFNLSTNFTNFTENLSPELTRIKTNFTNVGANQYLPFF